MSTVVLIPSSTDVTEGEVIWARRTDAGFEAGVLASLSDISELALGNADDVAVIVPGSDVVLHGANIPVRADVQARAAASFALEDDIAVDREALHFALGASAETGWKRCVAVVARAKMDGWLAALKRCGVTPAVLVPDFVLLPKDADTLSIVERGGRALVRLGDTMGFAVEAELLAHILPELLNQAEVKRVNIASANAAAFAPEAGWGARNPVAAPAPSDNEFAVFALENLDRAKEINLCQGEYAPRRAALAGFNAWKRAAALAAAVCIAYLGLLAVEGWRYAREAERLEARAEAVLVAGFPDIERVVNARAQLRARLADAGDGDPDRFFNLASMVFAAADPLPAVEIQGLQFDSLRGDLAVDVAFRTYPDLEQLKTSIAETGGTVEEGGSRQEGEWIVGEVRVVQR